MEYSVEEFQYGSLPQKLSESIIEKENILNGIKHRYAKEVGKVFYEAQQEFSDYNNGGLFEKWYSSLGFKKRNVYNYIQIYNEVQQLHGDQLETFEELPKRLQLEISKPSHNPELKKRVLDGDIKTHKQYKEMERKAKEYEKQLKEERERNDSLAKQNEIANRKIEDLENVEPEVIEKYYEPDDYKSLKSSLTDKENYIAQLRNELSKLKIEQKEVSEKSQKYDELNQAINEMNGRLSEGQLRIKNQKMVYDLVQKSEQLLKEVAPLTYALDQLDVEDNEYAKKPILNIIKSLDEISNKLKRQLKEKQIIEVN